MSNPRAMVNPPYHCLLAPKALLHCTALHCTALHCTALHCTALHCTALHCVTLRSGAARWRCARAAKSAGAAVCWCGGVVVIKWCAFRGQTRGCRSGPWTKPAQTPTRKPCVFWNALPRWSARNERGCWKSTPSNLALRQIKPQNTHGSGPKRRTHVSALVVEHACVPPEFARS
jgi:hypothetical protein